MTCPHCGNNLRIKLEKGTAIKKRKKKDPNEPMDIDQFIKGCVNNKQRHINIVGEYADQLKQMKIMNGEYTTREQWGVFLLKNVRIARKMEPFTDLLISNAMAAVEKSLRSNGGYIDRFTLKTVFIHLVK